ncbi:MAG: ABC transporter substrate-binding protein [Clostridiales bacterium]|nr:ABC transporter substrate-binding protein [Clostridiales bacterium]
MFKSNSRLLKVLSMVLCLSMLLSLTGLAAIAEEDSSKVVVALASDPQNIGPFQGMSQGRIGILYTTYEFLVANIGGDMKGVMMKDYTMIDDLTYQCEIYDYIYDQAGNQVTASDVAFCYNTAIASGNLPKLGSIESITVVSDYVVEFKFTNLAIGDLCALWMECPIVTQASYEASADQMATDPVTTSAYQCVEYVSGSKMVFEDLGKYWQTDDSLVQSTSKHNVGTIQFDIVSDSAQRTNALKTKAIDVTNWLADADIVDFQGVEGYQVSQIPDNVTNFLLFNCDEEKGVFANNVKLREAVAYAIDKEMLLEGAYSGNGKVVKTWGNTKYADYQASWDEEEYFSYDLEKAMGLMAESGVSSLDIKLMYISTDEATKMATIIQALLMPMNINVTLCPYDQQLANEYKYKPEEWDLLLDQGGSTSYLVNVWKLGWDASGYVHGGAENFVKDETLQNLLNVALGIETHNDESMDAFHQYLKEQCYGVGLVQNMGNIAHTTKITNVVVDARGQVTPGACNYAN